MKYIQVNGNHYETGYQLGANLKEAGITVEGSPTFLLTDKRKAFARQCKEIYAKFFPEILEEIQGFATARQISPATIETILFSMYAIAPALFCSCMAVRQEDKVLLGRNSDFLTCLEDQNLHCDYHLSDGFSFVGNTTAYKYHCIY